MDLSVIRKTRLRLGMSQQELVQSSSVSLATLQNIESLRANPSIENLERILNALGLTLITKSVSYQWERLAFMGAALLVSEKQLESLQLPLSADQLLKEIRLASFDLEQNTSSRKKEAFQGLLLALHNHYPSLLKRIKSKTTQAYLPSKITGRLIKFRRISLERLSQYL